MAEPGLIKLRIEILDIAPPIWRRVAVADDLTLAELHLVIQGAFGWTDSHLHDSRTRTQRFSRKAAEPSDDLFGPDGGNVDLPEDTVTGAQVLNRKGARMVYILRSWRHPSCIR